MALPTSTPTDLVEGLRELAEISSADISVPLEQTTEFEAADLIEAWTADLTRIAEGEADAPGIAKKALAYGQHGIVDEVAKLRALLRPRSV